MGKQPGRHTDWLCNRRGLGAAAGTADRDWLTLGGTADAVKGVTLSLGSREAFSEEIRQVIHLLRPVEHFAARVMEMKLHWLEM